MKRKINKLLSSVKQGLFAFVLTVFVGTVYAQTTYSFSYTGAPQTLVLSGGPVLIQMWGANGGDNMQSGTGGKGGYATGSVNITSPGTYYIYVAGKGTTGIGGNAAALGGFNGGGDAGAYTGGTYGMGSGGGASHFASAPGLLNSLSANQSAVMIVAGGGGGSGSNNGPTNVINLGGNAGGLNGANGLSGTYGGFGGTQTAGGSNNSVPLYSGTMAQNGSFGQGGSASLSNSGFAPYPNNTGGGGGGGWYGGSAALWEGGGGGSSYVGGVNTSTIAGFGQPGYVPNPDNSGHGYVIITTLCDVNIQANKNPICFGESVTLSTNAVSNVLWANNSSTAPSIIVSPGASTNYTVSGQAASGCTTSVILTVTVHPLPVLSAVVQPTVLCVGSTASITASGANTFTWAASNQAGNTTTVNPVVNTSFTYSGTNQFNCVNSTLVSVVVNTNVLSVTPNTSVCKGSSTNVTATGAQTYTWSNGPMFASIPVSPQVNTTYTASGTDIHNCVLKNVVTVTVNDLPLVVATAVKTNVCKGETITLTGGGASTYTWNTGFVGSALNVTLPVDIQYYFSVTGTDANGCSKSANIAINVSKCVGINEVNNSTVMINVIPNPGPGLFNVNVEKVTDHLNMKVYNELGMLVKTQEILSTESKLDLQNEKSGLYFVRISEGENVMRVIKLIKE